MFRTRAARASALIEILAVLATLALLGGVAVGVPRLTHTAVAPSDGVTAPQITSTAAARALVDSGRKMALTAEAKDFAGLVSIATATDTVSAADVISRTTVEGAQLRLPGTSPRMTLSPGHTAVVSATAHTVTLTTAGCSVVVSAGPGVYDPATVGEAVCG